MRSSSSGQALEVWAGAKSRCHHTFAGPGQLAPASRCHVVRTDRRCSPGSEGVRHAPRRSVEIVRRPRWRPIEKDVALGVGRGGRSALSRDPVTGARLLRWSRRSPAPGGRGGRSATVSRPIGRRSARACGRRRRRISPSLWRTPESGPRLSVPVIWYRYWASPRHRPGRPRPRRSIARSTPWPGAARRTSTCCSRRSSGPARLHPAPVGDIYAGWGEEDLYGEGVIPLAGEGARRSPSSPPSSSP